MAKKQPTAKPAKKVIDLAEIHAKMFAKIPQGIKKVFTEYGLQDWIKLENTVAIRTAEEWYAVFTRTADGRTHAMDFRHVLDFDTHEWHWEVQNDEIDITEDEFCKGDLTRTFL